jgi:hypothetical protein
MYMDVLQRPTTAALQARQDDVEQLKVEDTDSASDTK